MCFSAGFSGPTRLWIHYGIYIADNYCNYLFWSDIEEQGTQATESVCQSSWRWCFPQVGGTRIYYMGLSRNMIPYDTLKYPEMLRFMIIFPYVPNSWFDGSINPHFSDIHICVECCHFVAGYCLSDCWNADLFRWMPIFKPCRLRTRAENPKLAWHAVGCSMQFFFIRVTMAAN